MAISAQLRDKAKVALLEGKYKQALECYIEMHHEEPDDMRIFVKLAELRERTGDTTGAVKDYVAIAQIYAEQGFVVQAIAINKIILRLDPAQNKVKAKLKELSSERGDDWAVKTMRRQEALALAAEQERDLAKGTVGNASPEKRDQVRPSFERTPLLSILSGDELESFIDSLQLRHVAAGDPIFNAGDAGTHLYLIGMGMVRLEARDVSGKRKVFQHLIEGDFFGEHAFMTRSTHTDWAIADTECDLLIIDRMTFDEWVRRYPSIHSTVDTFYRQRVLARVLAITPVFEGIPAEARLALAHQFELRTFQPGQVIVREGDQGNSFFLIRAGSVDVITQDIKKPGSFVPLGKMSDGAFFGEVALLTDKPRTATVLATSAVEVMELSRDRFNAIAAKYPNVRKIVEHYQKQRVQDTIKTLLSHNR